MPAAPGTCGWSRSRCWPRHLVVRHRSRDSHRALRRVLLGDTRLVSRQEVLRTADQFGMGLLQIRTDQLGDLFGELLH